MKTTEVFVMHEDLGYDGSIFLGVRSTLQEAQFSCQQRSPALIDWKQAELDPDVWIGIRTTQTHLGQFEINREEMKINSKE